MKAFRVCRAGAVVFAATVWVGLALADAPTDQAREILNAAGLKGGLIVHLGCGDGRLTAALRINESFIVHGLDSDPANVQKAREYIRSVGLYGPVSVDKWDGRSLPYVDNLVNLIVASGDVVVAEDEVMRVLAPNGVALIGGRKVVKPWPKEIDDWTHDLHGPDGNPVGKDNIFGPPRHYQWLTGPRWQRDHDTDSSTSALVAARGRIFYIQDEGPIGIVGNHPVPDKWFLIARDAFNGVVLWKRPIARWGWREWKNTWFTSRLGSVPLNRGRRLVAVGDRVYVTLGIGAPVSQLDACTGETLRTYSGTEGANEILYRDGLLIISVVREGRVSVKVLQADTGALRWESAHTYRGSTNDVLRWATRRGQIEPPKLDPAPNLALDGNTLCLLDGPEVVCLDFGTGKERWRARPEGAEKDLMVGALIIHDKVVLYANELRLVSLSADSGQVLWSVPRVGLGFYSWKDVFVIQGLVWTWGAEQERTEYGMHPETKRPMRAAWPLEVKGYDLLTGEVKKSIPLRNIFKAPHHHRCYRNKATERYILASRRGSEFVDLEEGQHAVHNWIRATCHLGMIPAFGLQYAPPHPCVCYSQEKLNGFNVLAPARRDEGRGTRDEEGARLERGPAFSAISDLKSQISDSTDWPTYRHDSMRTGASKTVLPDKMVPLWSVKVGRKLAPPVVAGDTVLVSAVDDHLVVALDARTGQKRWEYSVGGRVDSPPTFHQGMALFGAADGWVYCLRASDGQLVWRFRAAPEDRRIGAFEQLESAWPLHGSVLVQNGVAYVAAGRSSFLDGGIYLFGLDALTGKALHQAHLEGPYMDIETFKDNFELAKTPGALTDIMQGDSQYIFMRDMTFDNALVRQSKVMGNFLRVTGGFLDDTYFKRISWNLGAGPQRKWGLLLVYDDRSVYTIRMFSPPRFLDPDDFFVPGKDGYLLQGEDREPSMKPRWSRRIPIRVQAMVGTATVLAVAGPPDVVDPKDPLAAFEGRKGGVVWLVSPASGDTLAEHALESPPVFNGLAAAGGRLFISTLDGRVRCMGRPE